MRCCRPWPALLPPGSSISTLTERCSAWTTRVAPASAPSDSSIRAEPLRRSPPQATRRASPLSRFCRSSRSGNAAADDDGCASTTAGVIPGCAAAIWHHRGSSRPSFPASGCASETASSSRRGWLRCRAEGLSRSVFGPIGCPWPVPGPWANLDTESGSRRRPRKTDEGLILLTLSGAERSVVREAGSRALGGLTSAIAWGRSGLARVARPGGPPLSDR
jgi:hypothetical protein